MTQPNRATVPRQNEQIPRKLPVQMQTQTAFDGPNQAIQDLERVYGLDANHADALLNQLVVWENAEPAGWRPSQTCFDLWHQGDIK